MVSFDQHSLLWVSGWGFVEQWDLESEERIIARFEGYNYYGPSVIVDEQGNIWLDTNQVQMYSQGVLHVFPNAHRLIIQAALSGNGPESIWAETWDRFNRICLTKYDEGEWEDHCLDSDFGVDLAQILAFGYRPHELWVNLYDNGGEGPSINLGIWKFDGQSWERILGLDDESTFYAILGTPQGSFWLVNSADTAPERPGNIKRYDGQSLVVDVEHNERIGQLVLGPGNTLWAIPSYSETMDVMQFDGTHWQTTSLRTELLDLIPDWKLVELLSLAVNQEGHMCLGTDIGVFCQH